VKHQIVRPNSPTTERLALPPAMLAVYDGQRCIGHLVNRGRSGLQALDANDRSLGVFATAQAAADAISNTANEKPEVVTSDPGPNFSTPPAKEMLHEHAQYPRRRRRAQ
jgi:hypothetical protein